MNTAVRFCILGFAVLFAPTVLAAADNPSADPPDFGAPATPQVGDAAPKPMMLAAAPANSRGEFDRLGAWYAGLHAAAAVVPDTDFVGGGLDMRVDFDPGFALGGSLGYAYDFGLRLETEVTFRVSQARRIEVGGTPMSGSGNLESLNLMLNGWYDVHFLSGLLGNWVPYFGGGAGLSHAWVNIGTIGIPIVESDDTAFAWQGGGGLAYKISEGLYISADYRFFRTFGSFSFEDPAFTGPIKAKYKVHSVTIGIRGHF